MPEESDPSKRKPKFGDPFTGVSGKADSLEAAPKSQFGTPFTGVSGKAAQESGPGTPFTGVSGKIPEGPSSPERVLNIRGEQGIVAEGFDGNWIIRLSQPQAPGKTVQEESKRLLQLTIRGKNQAGNASVYFGEAYGLGHNGLIDNTTDLGWTEFSAGGGKRFMLRIEFTPVARVEVIAVFSEAGDLLENAYLLGDGGTDGVVSIETQAISTPIPDAIPPSIDPSSGEVSSTGIYYVSIGTADASGGAQNSLYGPVLVGFCAPDSISVQEMVSTEV